MKFKRVRDEKRYLVNECKKMKEAIKFYKERMDGTNENSQIYHHYKAAYEHWTKESKKCEEKLKHLKFKLVSFMEAIIFVLSILSIYSLFELFF